MYNIYKFSKIHVLLCSFLLVFAFIHPGMLLAEHSIPQESAQVIDQENEHAEEMVITGTKTIKPLKETPVKTELITRASIEASGATNLEEALSNRTGVRIDNQCSICNTTSIKLSGMPGRYTLLLIDGFPIFSSLGQTYGLANIEAGQIEQIEVVKGASSVLYGTDAIGGVVNVITRKPGRHNFGTLSAQYGSYNSYKLSGATSARQGDLSSLVTMSHSSHDSVDRDGDGVSEFSGYTRSLGSGTLRWRASSKTNAIFRMAGAQEVRQGGGLGSVLEVFDDTDGRRAMSETILSKRIELGLRVDHSLTRALSTNLMLAHTFHDQDSDYEGEVYHAKQHIFVAQAELMASIMPNLHIIGGLPYRLEYLDENLAASHYEYHMTGLFAQADWGVLPTFDVVAGMRYDYHNTFGNVYTPRLAMKWGAAPWLTLRGGAGTGFRTPTTFYEYAHGVRPDGYVLENNAHKPERSLTTNLSATFDAGRRFSATVEGAWSRVNNPITVDVNEKGNIEVHNVDGNLEVSSAEISASGRPASWLSMNGGWGIYHYKDDDGALTSAPPSQQFNTSLDFNLANWGFKARLGADIMAPIKLRDVYGLGYNIKPGKNTLEGWLDEANADTNNPKLDKSPWFVLMNVRLQQRLTRGIYLYGGVDNLLDYHQSDKDGPMYFPANDSGAPGPVDVVHIWGPMRGRYVYGGLNVDF